MATLHSRLGERRSEPRPRTPSPGLIDEIIEVLNEFGGSAHRDVVIVRLAARRGLTEVSERLRRDLLNAFDAHQAACERHELLLWLPFGDGSRRWALTSPARQIADQRQRAGMVSAPFVEPVAIDMAASAVLG
jgi:hypothetical protein